MEASFWFIFVGLIIYGLHVLWRRYPVPLTWLIDILTGAGIGLLIGSKRPVTAGTIVIPLWLCIFSGALSAAMLWCSDRFKLFEKRSVQYSLMIILSSIHAGIILLVYQWQHLSQISDAIPNPGNYFIFIHFLLISALSFVGFTFPKRLLKTDHRD